MNGIFVLFIAILHIVFFYLSYTWMWYSPSRMLSMLFASSYLFLCIFSVLRWRHQNNQKLKIFIAAMLIHKQSTVTDHRQQGARTLKIVFCCVVGCSNRSEKCSSKSFYRIPAVVLHHDKETQERPSKRRSTWFSSIKRADIDTSPSFYRVFSDHFVNGKYF